MTETIETTCTETDENPVCKRAHRVKNFIGRHKGAFAVGTFATLALFLQAKSNQSLREDLDDALSMETEDDSDYELVDETIETIETTESVA